MIGRILKWYRKRKYKDVIIINDQSFFKLRPMTTAEQLLKCTGEMMVIIGKMRANIEEYRQLLKKAHNALK